MDMVDIRERLEKELFQKVEHEIISNRSAYEGKLREWEARYHAKRSVKGLLLTGQEDPEVSRLNIPYEGTADIGHLIEMTLIQELVPNVMTAHLGMTPYTETRRMGDKGLEPHGVVDDFIQYMMEQIGLRKIRRKTVLSGYKFAESPEKVICEPKIRTVPENRTLLMTKTKKKGKGKTLFEADGKTEIEIFDDEDIYQKMLTMVEGDDKRALLFRYNKRDLKLTEPEALTASGIEIKGDEDDRSIRVAPLLHPDPKRPPEPDWDKSTTYYPTEIEVNEPITVSQWPQIINVHPKDFIVPSDAESNNIMDYWNCHRYRAESLGWLIERKGDGEGDGFYPEVVDEIVDRYQNKQKDEKGKKEDELPEIWEVYDNFMLEIKDENSENYMIGTEIIAWFCNDNKVHPLLGWQVNPAVRFPMEHIRPFFIFQPKPEDHRYHGLCIPETGTGTRDMMDWLLNCRLNREAMYSDPILIESKDVFARQAKSLGGGGQRWIKEMGEILEVLKFNVPEGQSMQDEGIMAQFMRLLWGASEQLSGFRTRTDSGTAAEANLLAAKGANMFQDTVESISQVADLQYKYIKCFYEFSDAGKLKFPVRPDKDNPDGQTIEITRKLLEGPMVIKSRRIITEAEREVKMTAIRIVYEFLGKLQSPLLKDAKFTEQMINELFDALNMENIDIPTAQEMMQEQAQIQKMSQEMIEKERYFKALDQVKNKGARNQIEEFLKSNAPGAIPGAPGVSGGGPAIQGGA